MTHQTHNEGTSPLLTPESYSGILSAFPSTGRSNRNTTNTYAMLKPRQITMIAIGGAINTGLMIGAGGALAKAGPASILISYTAVGLLLYLVLCALGEVASSFPGPSSVTGHAGRCCDPALGFTIGWMYWLKFVVVTPNQLTAGALVISHWVDAQAINPGIWITIFLSLIIAANYWGNRFLGQYEFLLSSFKITVLLGLMMFALVLALGGGPDHDRKGFRYWKDSGAFAGQKTAMGRLRAICSTVPAATFAYAGSELIGMTILHTQNPRKAAVRAIKLTFYRILVLNVTGVILLGMIIPYDLASLVIANGSSKPVTASAFVAAVQSADISVLAHILNACILLFVLSAANQALCMATRVLYGLALEQNAPAFLSRTDEDGTPLIALGVCSGFASLAYLNISRNSAAIFNHFVNMVTMFSLLTWVSILVTHLSFVRARRAQKIPDEALTFRAPLGAAGSLLALGFCVLITIIRSMDVSDYLALVTSYIAIPLYLGLFLGYKFVTRCKSVDPAEADLGGMARSHGQEDARVNSDHSPVELVRREKGQESRVLRLVPAWML